MPTQIKDIVNTSISIGQYIVGSAGFSTPLIMDEVIRFGTRVQSYTSKEAMLEAGFLVTDKAYISAKNIFDQTSKKGKKTVLVKVGRKLSDQNCIQNIIFNADATAGTFTVSLGAEESNTINYDDNAAAIETAIEATVGITSVTVTFNTGATQAGDKEGFKVEFDGADANTDFAVLTADVSSLTGVTSATITKPAFGSATETWTTAYSAIRSADKDWYIALPTTTTQADLELIAAAAASDPVQVWMLTRDTEVKDGTAGSVSKTLKALDYSNSSLFFSRDTASYMPSAEAGAALPDFLGGINPCYYPLVGVVAENVESGSITTSITDAEIQNLVADNVNRVENVGGFNMMMGTATGLTGRKGGITVGGDRMTSIFAKHYLEAKINESVFQLIVNSTKLSFKYDDLAAVRGSIRQTLQNEGVDKGIIDEDSIEIVMPVLTTYSPALKASGELQIDGGNIQELVPIDKIVINFNLTV